MNQGELAGLLLEGGKVLFIITSPFILAVAVASTIFAALQSATSIKEESLLYAVKVGVVLIVAYLMMPLFSSTILDFISQIWGHR